MPEQGGPKVILRGPADGDSINLPMDGLHARIVRKASRSETSGGFSASGRLRSKPRSSAVTN